MGFTVIYSRASTNAGNSFYLLWCMAIRQSREKMVKEEGE